MGWSDDAKGRTIVVGDVHGCRDELEALLALVHFDGGADRLVLVGDVVMRGPDPRGVLALLARLGARSVRGNHEEKLLQGRDDPHRVHGEYRRLARSLSEDDWRLLEAMPYWIDLPAHDLRVVHAGVIPGEDIHATPHDALFLIRAVDERGRWTSDKNAPDLWGGRYTGPPHVVFGHNALPGPQLHEWATGIDTGCVYGGKLTAVVLDAGERLARGKAAARSLVSVPAASVHHAVTGASSGYGG